MIAIVSKIWILLVALAFYNCYEIYNTYSQSVGNYTSVEIPSLKKRIKRKKHEIKVVKKYLENIAEAKEEMEIVLEQVEKTKQKLPDVINDTKNLSVIRKHADSLNIKVVSLSPRNELNKGFYFTKRYEFIAQGTYLQFLLFFEKLGIGDVLLNVISVNLDEVKRKRGGRFQLLSSKIVIEAYRYNVNYKEDTEVKLKGEI